MAATQRHATMPEPKVALMTVISYCCKSKSVLNGIEHIPLLRIFLGVTHLFGQDGSEARPFSRSVTRSRIF